MDSSSLPPPPPPVLSLDYKPNIVYAMNSNTVNGDHRSDEIAQKLQDFIACLEEERLKIDAFKRELPLCMQILNNAVENYRQQLDAYQTRQGAAAPPVLEEFIPLKNASNDGSISEIPPPNATSEKASWMVSAQLWTPPSDLTKQQIPAAAAAVQSAPPPLSDAVSPKLVLDTKQRNGGAFLPFSKRVSSVETMEVEVKLGGSELEMKRENGIVKASAAVGAVEQGKATAAAAAIEGQAVAPAQTHRKARRCWSPDLHRRFVSALQILGGSQVATPKQIRELMKVDGLTNDEVKSHLQKYRLHTRRPIQPPQASATAPPHLVVLGGIWVPPDYAATAAAGQAIYGAAHPAPPHYCQPQALPPQEFYHVPPQHLHPALHRTASSAAAATAAATAASSPYKARSGSHESDMRSGGERSESIDDEEVEGREEDEEEREDEDEKLDEKATVRPEPAETAADITLSRTYMV